MLRLILNGWSWAIWYESKLLCFRQQLDREAIGVRVRELGLQSVVDRLRLRELHLYYRAVVGLNDGVVRASSKSCTIHQENLTLLLWLIYKLKRSHMGFCLNRLDLKYINL